MSLLFSTFENNTNPLRFAHSPVLVSSQTSKELSFPYIDLCTLLYKVFFCLKTISFLNLSPGMV